MLSPIRLNSLSFNRCAALLVMPMLAADMGDQSCSSIAEFNRKTMVSV